MTMVHDHEAGTYRGGDHLVRETHTRIAEYKLTAMTRGDFVTLYDGAYRDPRDGRVYSHAFHAAPAPYPHQGYAVADSGWHRFVRPFGRVSYPTFEEADAQAASMCNDHNRIGPYDETGVV